MATNYFCDKCGEEIREKHDIYTLVVNYYGFRANKTADLCGVCAKELNEKFLGDGKKIWYVL